MSRFVVILTALTWFTAAVPVSAEATKTETVSALMQQDLLNVPGKSFTSVIVTFPPGARAAPHRHAQAFVFAYVLEGSVRSQLDNEPAGTCATGQSWSEPPGAHHIVTENVSPSMPAKLLVVFISDKGEPLKSDNKPNPN
jgi:quercetin dioxygenase-like cupin family protein